MLGAFRDLKPGKQDQQEIVAMIVGAERAAYESALPGKDWDTPIT
jgi:hypothetical protein